MAALTQPAGQLAPPFSSPIPPVTRPRLDSVDLLRGLIMILMALDHTRGFFSNATFYPLDLDKTNVPLFLTRWFTHYCAPLFVFLAGAGAFLSSTRGKTKGELSWYLVTRGAWLILLEITIIRWTGWSFSLDMHFIGVGVIWAIGWSMIALAGLIHLPLSAVALFGVIMIAGHNALDPIRPESFGPLAWLWQILHTGGGFEFAPGYRFGAGYPLIPWIGVMAAGYAFGSVMLWNAHDRQRWMWKTGTAAIVLFILLRGSNLYGDTGSWTAQKNDIFTIFSFIHVQKYPPSLLYLLMTIGPGLILLSVLDRWPQRWLQPVVTFGRVPLFYYLLHLPLIHGLAVLFNYGRYGRADWLMGWPLTSGPPQDAPSDKGFGLLIVYLVWILAVLILYPVCRWFADVKRRRREAWLTYL
jgi:uncharacterized membrane protein